MMKCYLSIAGIKILLETEHLIIKNEEFLPFFIQETKPDIYASVKKADKLPEIPQHILYKQECYVVAINAEGKIQKFFYETPKDSVYYAVSTYCYENGKISVEYLNSYHRCVSEVQNCFYLLGFESILLKRKKLCLHASCVDTPLGGILFSGVSGIGKSTQAELWCKYRKARQINGDRPILSKEEKGWMAWGSPYAGSSKYHVNESCSVAAIVLLKQAQSCSLRRLTQAEAFRGVWAGLTIHSWDPSFVEDASFLTIDLIKNVPVFEFNCTPDENAVDYLEQALRKEYDV